MNTCQGVKEMDVTRRRVLIVNADDFGLAEGVSRGIIHCHKNGIVTSTTLMANMPSAREAASMARDVPGLSVGVHLVLTAGKPVRPPEKVPSLVRDGRFVKNMWRLMSVNRVQVRDEWRAQIEQALSFGITPTHLDSHHNVHFIPGLTEVAVDLAREYKIPAMRTCTRQDIRPDVLHLSPTLVLLYSHYCSRARRLVERSGLGYNHRLIGLTPNGVALDPGRMEKALSVTGDGVFEMVCHPGFADDELRSISSLTGSREVELATMTSPTVRKMVADAGFELLSYSIFRKDG
ncbi:MAG: carbohydrate deacetylase [Bacillota bacterium]